MNVAIVFNPDFAARLQTLAFHTPVWIIETPQNRAAAEEAWMRRQEWPHIAITLFRPEEEWRALLAQIAIEHAVDGVEVIGHGLTEEARTELREAGYQKFDRTPEGFRARKT